MNDWYEQRRAEGRCVTCGAESRGVNKNTGKFYTLCTICHEQLLEKQLARRARLKKQDRCRTCEVEVTDINLKTNRPYRYCPRCRIKAGRFKVEQRNRYIAKGRCRTCGNPIKKPGAKSCNECLNKMNIRAKERYAEKRARRNHV